MEGGGVEGLQGKRWRGGLYGIVVQLDPREDFVVEFVFYGCQLRWMGDEMRVAPV